MLCPVRPPPKVASPISGEGRPSFEEEVAVSAEATDQALDHLDVVGNALHQIGAQGASGREPAGPDLQVLLIELPQLARMIVRTVEVTDADMGRIQQG